MPDMTMPVPAWLHASLRVDYGAFLPMWAQERRFGWATPAFAAVLQRWPRIFECKDQRIGFSTWVESAHARSEAVAEVLSVLRTESFFAGWRDERFSVYAEASGEPLFSIERGAIKRFGIRGRATHINGLVENPSGVSMWISRRASNKSTDPGKYDNLVGGGIGEGYDAWDTLLKEAWEEAGVPLDLAQSARPRDTLRFDYLSAEGLDSNEVECFDLSLPTDFQPTNQDGEVDRFELIPLEEIYDLLRRPHFFTVDAALVIWNCLRRWQQPDD
jgi:8-oxo-dGTP pyrophosphatase MutT (NUDIX family)